MALLLWRQAQHPDAAAFLSSLQLDAAFNVTEALQVHLRLYQANGDPMVTPEARRAVVDAFFADRNLQCQRSCILRSSAVLNPRSISGYLGVEVSRNPEVGSGEFGADGPTEKLWDGSQDGRAWLKKKGCGGRSLEPAGPAPPPEPRGHAGTPGPAVAEAPWSVAEWAVALRFDNPRATVQLVLLLE